MTTPTDPRKAIRDLVVPGLQQGLAQVLHGAAADLEKYAAAIADDITLAVLADDEPLLEELYAQARALAHIQQIRIQGAGLAILRGVVRTATGIAVAALTQGLVRIGE